MSLAGVGILCNVAVAQPANDNFANAIVLTGNNGTQTADLTDATPEPGEPNHAGATAAVSIWYSWTAPADGPVQIDTYGSPYGVFPFLNLDPVLAVYTGNNLSNLNLVAANADVNGSGPGSWLGPAGVRFNAKGGTTYRIAVDDAFAIGGPVSLGWAYQASGVFRFSRDNYFVSESDAFGPVGFGVDLYTPAGALVTVVREFGSVGKVLVDIETADVTAIDGLDYGGISTTLVFEDHEMSKGFFIPLGYDGGFQLDNRDFTVTITAVNLDPLESSDVAPPRIDPDHGITDVTITDFEMDPNLPFPLINPLTNQAVVNIAKTLYRTIEPVDPPFVGKIVEIEVYRRTRATSLSTTVGWVVSSSAVFGFGGPGDYSNNGFRVQAGSDYATPDPETLNPAGVGPPDFFGYPNDGGTLSWSGADQSPKIIQVAVYDDGVTEFNEDIQILIYSFDDPSAPDASIIGYSGSATLTILFDEYPAGGLDTAYNPDFSVLSSPPGNSHPGANAPVYAVAMQPDDKAVIVGDFTAYNTVPRNFVARVNIDGNLDSGFNPGSGANAFINSVKLEPSGKMIVGGGFTAFDGAYRYRVARLNANGSLDNTFTTGLGCDETVWTVAIQAADGKVIIGGDFTSVDGHPRNHVARLNTDGSLDLTFDPGVGPNAVVNVVEVQTDGKVVIGGEFTTVGGTPRARVARLNSDGTLDTGFNPGAGADGPVFAMALQTDGKILVGGAFKQMDLRSRRSYARLNADGTLDTTFSVGVGADDVVYNVTLQTDGKIYLGGLFDSVNGTRRVGLARLFSNGEVDTGFLDTAYNHFAGFTVPYFNPDVTPKSFIFGIGVQTDGKVIAGGGFTRVGGGRLLSNIQPDILDTQSGTPRFAYRNRNNLTRLLGGSTTGPGSIGFAYDTYTVDENLSFLFVTLVRQNGTLGTLSANFTIPERPVGPGVGQSGVDYAFSNPGPFYNWSWTGTRMRSDGIFGTNVISSTVLGGQITSGTDDVFVTVLDDTLVQGNRFAPFQLDTPSIADSFYLGGEVVPIGGALGLSEANLTIVDNDSKPGVIGFASTGFGSPSYTVNENATNAVITLVRTNGTTGTVTVRFSTIPGGTATPGGSSGDYTAVTNTVTFGSGIATRTVLVPITPDSAVELDETILLRLSNPGGGVKLGATNATLTIIDDDFLAGRLNFAASSYATNEDSGAVTLTVTRTGGSLGVLSVQYALSNLTATAGTDYTSVAGTLSWNNNETTPRNITVPLLSDATVEPDEIFTAHLFNPSIGGALGGVTTVPVTILNDDFYGKVQFSTASYFINEFGGEAIIAVVRAGGSAEAVSINYSVSGITAVPGVDFSPTAGTLSFGPGELSKSFTVPIIDNPNPDIVRTIALTLSGQTPTGSLGFPSTAILTIVDDETVNEPPGGVDTAYNPDAGFNDDVNSLALQADGKLVAGGNFTTVNGLGRNRIVRLNQDGSLDQMFLNGLSGANGIVRAVINQTDGRVVVGGGFTAMNSVNRSRIARLNYDGTLDGAFNPGSGADNPVFALAEAFIDGQRKIYAGGSFTVMNGTQRNGIVRLNDDGTVDAVFNPGLGANGIVYAVAVQADGKVIIGGDFTSVNGVARNYIARLNPNGSVDTSFAIGSGADAPVRALAIQLDGRILVGGSFINFNGTPQSRIARLLPSGNLDPEFLAGVGANDTVNAISVQGDTKIILGGNFTRCNGVTRNYVTRLQSDGTVDPSINFGAGANNFVGATVVQTDNRIIIGGGFTQYDGLARQRLARIYGGSIAGSGSFEFVSANFQALESGTNVIITVRRRGGTAGQPAPDNVTVDLTTADMTAINGVHFVGGTNTLVFPPGEVFQNAVIPIIDDFEVNDDRIAVLSLDNIQPPGSASLGYQPTAFLSIINDDSAISFSTATYSRNETSINGSATITLVRIGAKTGTSSVEFNTVAGGTATPGVDYIPQTNVLVTFFPGELQKNVIVPIIPDSSVEGDETVFMSLTNGSGALLLAPITAVLTIVDDDFGPGEIAFASTSYAVGESDGNAVINLLRINGRAGVVTVNLKASDISATAGLDYAVFNAAVSFGDGETNKSILIPIFPDNFVEGEELFQLTLTNATGGAIISGPTTALVTILDDDVGITVGSPVYAVGEDAGSVTISVLRINGSNGVATVQYTTANGTAVAGQDYSLTSGLLTFNNGEFLKTFTVPVLDDSLVEGDEAFTILLSNPSGGAQLLGNTATVTILDNDSALGFSPVTYSVDEGATNAVLTILRTNANTGPVTVTFGTVNGTATAGSDFSAVGGQLSFTNGETAKTLLIPLLNDTQVEGDETFQVTLANPVGAQLLPSSTATVTIVDNDAGVQFSSSSYTVTENGVSALITVLRTTVTNSTIGVNYSAANGTATNGQDFVAVSGTLVFATGEVSKTFNVPIIDDTIEEGAETVLLSLSSPTGQVSLLSPNSAVLTIVDNDGGSILPAGSLLTFESGPVNGAIDPGETVTALIAMRNVSGQNTTNLVATLLTTNGVTSPSGPQNYGALVDGGASVSRSFTFTASGTNGDTVLATFLVQDGSVNYGRVRFSYQLGSSTTTVSNAAPITILDSSGASPYPSTIVVSGLAGTVSKVTATITNLGHNFPDDIDILLVGPTGTNVVLMSDAGGINNISGLTLTFDDAAAGSLPDSTLIAGGTYKPTNFGPDAFPVPAPPAPWGSTLAAFNGSNPNGTWSLFVIDDSPGGAGGITNGWKMQITTTGVIPATSDLSVKMLAPAGPAIVGSNISYTITVTNHGPWATTGTSLSNAMPVGAVFVSATPSTGSISTNSGQIVWTIGNMAKDAVATATVVVRPGVAGNAVSTSSVFASQSDPNLLNNVATTTTVISPPTADLGVNVVDAPDPVYYSTNISLVYTITVTNAGPATATGIAVTNELPLNVLFLSATPGGYTRVGNIVTFTNLGNLSSNGQTVATITVRPLGVDTLTNTTSCGSADVIDPFKGNNTVSVKTLVATPQMSIARVGNNLVIGWPVDAPTYTLWRATSLTAPVVWTQVTSPPPVVVGNLRTVTLPLGGGSEYFRLQTVAP